MDRVDSAMQMYGSSTTVIFYCPEYAELATSLASNYPDEFSLGAILWDTFEDGFPRIRIQKWNSDVRNRHVIFLSSISMDVNQRTNFFEQISVCFQIPRSLATSFTLVLPYFPTGTMDRMNVEEEVATAHTLAKILSTVPQCAGSGPSKILTFDIHALQERFFFSENVIPMMATAVPLFYQEISKKHLDKNEIAIVFPDEGARKRFGIFFEKRGLDITCCSKRRMPDGSKRIYINDGCVENKHAYIVDDLIKTGGTILSCAAILRESGALSINAFVTHPVFPNKSYEKFTQGDFNSFYVSDSIPVVSQKLQGKQPFHILSIEKAIHDILCNPNASNYFVTDC